MDINQEIPSGFHALDSEHAFDALMERSQHEPVVIFKHSKTCGISALAYGRVTENDPESDPPIYLLIVQTTRALSQHIANQLSIRHESPQVIVVYKKEPVFHTSHGSITLERIRNATTSALTS